MFPCSHFHHVKEALFGVCHYNGALSEFHNQKGGKKITAGYKKALDCFMHSAIYMREAFLSFFSSIGQSSELSEPMDKSLVLQSMAHVWACRVMMGT